MTKGRNTQLTKQAGEYLVAAELCRRGLTATTFTGHMPDYDIVAVSDNGNSVLVQVKTTRSGSWQFGDARVFLAIEQRGRTQLLGDRTTVRYRELVFVFIRLGEYGRDRFFILTWAELQDLICTHYQAHLDRQGGVRPRRHDSYHVGLGLTAFEPYEDRWKVVKGALDRAD